MNHFLQSFRRNFLAGLFVVLPLVLTIWLLIFFFNWATETTSALLFLLPQEAQNVFLTPDREPRFAGRILTLILAVLLLVLLGAITRHVVGKGLVEKIESLLLKVPLLNKVYPTVKEIVVAFQPGRQSAFREAVLVEFPSPGSHSIGFVTGELPPESTPADKETLVSVFLPTTPNPTSGYLLLLPRRKITPLPIPVAEAIKLVISGGAVTAGKSNAALENSTSLSAAADREKNSSS